MTDQELFDKACDMAEKMETEKEYRQFAAFMLYHLDPNDQRLLMDDGEWKTDDVWQIAIIRKLKTLRASWDKVRTDKLNVMMMQYAIPESSVIAHHIMLHVDVLGYRPSPYEGSKWDENRSRETTTKGPETRKEGTGSDQSGI